MPRFARLAIIVAALVGAAAGARAADDKALEAALRGDLRAYLTARGAVEHISAASLSVSLPGGAPSIDLAEGTTTFGGTTPVTPSNLFQIGSNTKAFTAALLLQLEAEHRLSLKDTLAKWAPQYPAWKDVSLERLLNMTSGIVGYDHVPAMLADYASAPDTVFSAEALIAYAYPKDGAAPVAKGWDYTNTAYILSQLVIEKAGGRGYAEALADRLLGSAHGLADTHYEAAFYPPAVTDQMVSGYFFSTDADNAPLAPILGRDVKTFSVSWMQGAGGIVATPADVARWVRKLYTGGMLAPAQRRELMSLVSVATGQPIAVTSLTDPRGFGLGVAQLTNKGVGTFWYYEGETLGYRVIYAWLPEKDAVIVVGLNSQPNAKEDHIGELVQTLYATLHTAGKL